MTVFPLYFQDWESFAGFVTSATTLEETGESSGVVDSTIPLARNAQVKEAVRKWAEIQAGQRILVTTPSIVVGYRAQVYRAEGATQWYTAVIVSNDEETGVTKCSKKNFYSAPG